MSQQLIFMAPKSYFTAATTTILFGNISKNRAAGEGPYFGNNQR